MTAPKMVSTSEMGAEGEKLRTHVADLLRSGRITDGVALKAVALALSDQEWMPEGFIARRMSVYIKAIGDLASISKEVVDATRGRS